MTDSELLALCNAATPGPWEAEQFGRYEDDPTDLRWRIFLRGADNPQTNSRDCDWVQRDAAFIAASRTAVPELLERVRRLEAERDEARMRLEILRDEYLRLAGDYERCTTARDTLRASLAAVEAERDLAWSAGHILRDKLAAAEAERDAARVDTADRIAAFVESLDEFLGTATAANVAEEIRAGRWRTP